MKRPEKAETLEGALESWERAIDCLWKAGGVFAADDYPVSLYREHVDAAWWRATDSERAAVQERLEDTDALYRRLTVPSRSCNAGDEWARQKGWTPEANWWLFRDPIGGWE